MTAPVDKPVVETRTTTPPETNGSGSSGRQALAGDKRNEHLTVIKARRGWVAINWAELWEHRELLGFLVLRDIKVRYKQTVLGVAWAVLQPVFAMLIFTVIFGRFAKIPSEDMPYAVFVYAGLLPWTFFSTSVTQAAQSLISQEALLTKIYLPRLFVPAAPVGGALVDLAISFGVFAVIMAFYRVAPGWGLAMLPGLILMTIVAALGVGMLLAALTVSYRDFRFVIPFMMQVWMYASPVIYPVNLVPEEYRWILALNPLGGIIDGFRAALLDRPFDVPTLAISATTSLGMFLFGVFYFRKMERRFADIA
jgi:lipopolysaccharide transport system permease protein